jgi:hypothetical protein
MELPVLRERLVFRGKPVPQVRLVRTDSVVRLEHQ